MNYNKVILSEEPLLFYIDNFLTDEECDHLINISKDKMIDSVVSGVSKGILSQARSGKTFWLDKYSDPVGRTVAGRVAKLVDGTVSKFENYQIIWYGEENQYKHHFDAYDMTTEVGKRCTDNGRGQRQITSLLYLNTVEEGGQTDFPKLNSKVSAVKGRIVVFHNCYKDTQIRHPNSLHAGLPVKKGEKWACNLWLRDGKC